MKARPSLEKRRRELKLLERRSDKAERRRLRKEASPSGVGSDETSPAPEHATAAAPIGTVAATQIDEQTDKPS